MPNPAPTEQPAGRAGAWDRAALIALAALAFALSYNALRQTAAAARVQGPLTYAFPLIIDGFIAYGVRALLILRRAHILARAYAWLLFTAATAASTWANVLHGIRLNQQSPTVEHLRLSDHVVGALAVIAPLALAGVVHLYILITRETAAPLQPKADLPEASTDISSPTPPEPTPTERDAILSKTDLPPREPDQTQAETGPDRGGDRPGPARRMGRPPSAELDDLITLARPLFTLHEKPTRALVRDHIRGEGHSISEDRLTQVMTALDADRHRV
ncbi:DUF2637 domain-containing protein [Streptomyces sp. NPDC051976]|uniref:DUF2637 domain-containing protein n=1 Tax=Streptomyces sp. NPDC051976 TaxID=3154947 RepID=UPI00341FD627